jgi:flagellar assembly protein FliH
VTEHRSASTATPFQVPTLSPLAAFRDRSDAAHEYGARLRDEGFRAGYQVGLEAAAADTDRAIDDHRRATRALGRAIVAVESAAAALERRDAVALAEVERDAVALAVELAAELIGRELTITERPVLDALQRAARLTPDRGTPRIRVHPDDESAVRAAVRADAVRWTADAEIVGDPSIEPGGCVVDVGACRVDAQIGTAIERMRAALG